MIISNEPGYYKEGHFGIRIENLVYINKNKFEELTMAPIEKDLINKKMLNKKEVDWINKYHNKVKKNLFKFMNFKEKIYLLKLAHLFKALYQSDSVIVFIFSSLALSIFSSLVLNFL